MGIRTFRSKIWLGLYRRLYGRTMIIISIPLGNSQNENSKKGTTTYVHNWDCCNILSSPKGRHILQCPGRLHRTSRRHLRRNRSANAIVFLVRRWRNKPTTRSSNSRRLCTAGGCKRAPSMWDRHSRTISGNRVRHKSLCAVVVLRRTGESSQSILTIQTIHLP